MGTWGPGVFANDHALDLLSIEVNRLAGLVEGVLARDGAAFDDIEGPLLYVHILSLLAQERELRDISRDVVARWKEKYLHIFKTTVVSNDPGYVEKRTEVIAREFDSLASRAGEATPEPPPKARTNKSPKPSPERAPKKRRN